MNEKVQKKYRIVTHICTILGLAATVFFFVYAYQTGILTSEEAMKQFLEPFGFWAPLIFVLIQAVQVVIPILPGAVGCVVGVVLFGAGWGFVYNYIGICIGSCAAFLLARYYGQPFIEVIASPRLYKRYIGWLEKNQRTYDRLFALAIFFPVAPDDFLCYLSGVTKMSLKRFVSIILLGKPMAIALYSLGLQYVMTRLLGLLA